MSIVDSFSQIAGKYALSRPTYPLELYQFLAEIVPARKLAWDSGTGSGQAARHLAEYFDRVYASDRSFNQVRNAAAHPNVRYLIGSEALASASKQIDLISVAQAVHWFDLDLFYNEVRRVVKEGGVVAVWGYHFSEIDSDITPEIDRILRNYYFDVLGKYWHPRIRLLEQGYRSLPFPFEEITHPQFTVEAEWDLRQLIGFLDSWSATVSYLAENKTHPLKVIENDLQNAWGEIEGKRLVRWPVFLRVGRI